MEFLARFSKQYLSKSELMRRFKVFKENMAKIKAHNSRSSFKLGLNRFSDMTEEEFLETYGKGLAIKPVLKSDHPWDDEAQYDENGRYIDRHDAEQHNYFDYNDYKYIDETLEHCGKEVNWVKEGKVSPPKQQNTCGSCWAHSTVASVETLYAIV